MGSGVRVTTRLLDCGYPHSIYICLLVKPNDQQIWPTNEDTSDSPVTEVPAVHIISTHYAGKSAGFLGICLKKLLA